MRLTFTSHGLAKDLLKGASVDNAKKIRAVIDKVNKTGKGKIEPKNAHLEDGRPVYSIPVSCIGTDFRIALAELRTKPGFREFEIVAIGPRQGFWDNPIFIAAR